MGFLPQQIIQHAPWDSKTDEQVHAFGGAATWAYTVPSQCVYVIFSGDAGAVNIFTSPDSGDTNSGILWNNDVANLRLSMHVKPGTVIQHHAAGAINLNVLQFYNTPT